MKEKIIKNKNDLSKMKEFINDNLNVKYRFNLKEDHCTISTYHHLKNKHTDIIGVPLRVTNKHIVCKQAVNNNNPFKNIFTTRNLFLILIYDIISYKKIK